MGLLTDDKKPVNTTIVPEDIKPSKIGYVDTKTVIEGKPKITASSLMGEIEKSNEELFEYDPEMASLHKESSKELGPDTQFSYESALAADQEALDYYRNTVMPEMDRITKEATSVKSQEYKPNHFLLLAAALLAPDEEDGVAFYKAYMATSAEKFKTQRERELAALQDQAEALSRAMSLQEKTSTVRHRAVVYGERKLNMINQRLANEKNEFALSKQPALEAVSKKLGVSMYRGMLDPQHSTDLSKNNVLTLVNDELKRYNLPDISSISDSQKTLLHNVALKYAAEVSQSLFTSELKRQERVNNAPTPDTAVIQSWMEAVKPNSNVPNPYALKVKLIKNEIEDNSTIINTDIKKFQTEINKNLERIVNILNSSNNITIEDIQQKVISFASLPTDQRDAAIRTYLSRLDLPSYTPASDGKKSASSLSEVNGIYGYKIPQNYTAFANIKDSISKLDKFSAYFRSKVKPNEISGSVDNAFNAFDTNLLKVYETMISMAPSTDEKNNYEAVKERFNNEFIKDAIRLTTIKFLKTGQTKEETMKAISSMLDAYPYEKFLASKFRITTNEEEKEESTFEIIKNYSKLSLEDKERLIDQYSMIANRSMPENHMVRLFKAVTEHTTKDINNARMNKGFNTLVDNGLGSIQNILLNEASNESSISMAILPPFNLFGTSMSKEMYRYLLSQMEVNTENKLTPLKLIMLNVYH